ncbi:DUF7668 domain-containing protein [Lysobacter niastensis]|uniref:DUF7668 domain-containing protein n=1 Tax=Lysobacter niastensis TaxID=380629 RepID=A0ABS0B584_9GAMM|nr:hypothetical protein [Lysobacter niastensis]MBF6023964.1 hypothetical protein [Lysobacter niastensis]
MSDESASEERPIPVAWRQTFREIVAAFVAADYRLVTGVPGVEPVSTETATQIHTYISDYGATLVALPEEAWESSVCIWMGSHWDTLIDLWAQEEGRSDLVLQARVTDIPSFSVKVHLVYVP